MQCLYRIRLTVFLIISVITFLHDVMLLTDIQCCEQVFILNYHIKVDVYTGNMHNIVLWASLREK